MEDIKKLKSLMESNQNGLRSCYTGFKDTDEAYLCTNEDLRGFKPKNIENKEIITVTASGDQILHFALLGAKKITAFDINVFAKYVSMLKIAMIKTYDEDRYSAFFKNLYNPHIIKVVLEDAGKYLSDSALEFWNFYVNYMLIGKENINIRKTLFGDVLNNSFFSTIGLCSYKGEESFKKLKENISDLQISYVDSSLEDLGEKINHKYDGLYASNIIQRIHEYYYFPVYQSTTMDYEMLYSMIQKMSEIIKDDGVIWDYFLGIDYPCINTILGPYQENFEKKFITDVQKSSNGKIYTYKKRLD